MRWLPTLAALVVIAAGLALGNWQLNRAAEKYALQRTLEARVSLSPLDLNTLTEAEITAEDFKYRRAKASGLYLPEGQILIDNRSLGEEIGYYVLTPLKVKNKIWMVNRGFLKKNPLNALVPEVSVPHEVEQVEGELTLGKTRFFELSKDTVQGKIWQNFKPEAYSKMMGYEIAPWVLNLIQPAPGLKAVSDQPDLGIDTHRGYAFQWFALAFTTACIYLYFTFIKKSAVQ
jgi:cytochrome oxidase assembly protein ShyY1